MTSDRWLPVEARCERRAASTRRAAAPNGRSGGLDARSTDRGHLLAAPSQTAASPDGPLHRPCLVPVWSVDRILGAAYKRDLQRAVAKNTN